MLNGVLWNCPVSPTRPHLVNSTNIPFPFWWITCKKKMHKQFFFNSCMSILACRPTCKKNDVQWNGLFCLVFLGALAKQQPTRLIDKIIARYRFYLRSPVFDEGGKLQNLEKNLLRVQAHLRCTNMLISCPVVDWWPLVYSIPLHTSYKLTCIR